MSYKPIFDEERVQEALSRFQHVLGLKDDHQYKHEHSAHGFWAETWFSDIDKPIKNRRIAVKFGRIGVEGGMRFTVLRREEDDPKVAGMFIEDSDGSIYAAHSGDFDAKAKDPHLFKQNTEKDDNWVEVEGQDERWYLFTRLDRGIGDAKVLSNIARFVRDRFESRHETSQQIGKQPLTRESKRRTSLNTMLYGPPGTGKTWKTLKRCVEICDGQAGDNYRERYRELIESERRVKFVTFHQTYGYEEFVEGLRPKPSTEGTGFKLVAKPGVLKRLAERARGDSENKPHVLVIDEINRANISKVMGELITLLEEDKREGGERGESDSASFRQAVHAASESAHPWHHEHRRSLHRTHRHGLATSILV